MSGKEPTTVNGGEEESQEAWEQYDRPQWKECTEDPLAKDPIIMEYVRREDRRIRYRLRRDASLSRDEPTRLPCRPYYNNGDMHEWDDTRLYQQPRVYQEEMDPKHHLENRDTCYTCTNHRLCLGPVCEATASQCEFCDSEQGPYRIRNHEKAALARKVEWGV